MRRENKPRNYANRRKQSQEPQGQREEPVPVFLESTSYLCPEIGAKANLTSEDPTVFIFHGVVSSLTAQCVLRAQSVCVALDMMFLWKSLQLEKKMGRK